MHDSRDRAAVFGAHDQHVAAVAIGDDLLLQVLRRVLAAQVGLERAAQPRRCLRSRSRMLFSSGLASSTTSPAGSILRRTSAISRSNDADRVGDRAQDRKVPRAADARRRWRPPTRGSRESEQVRRLERVPSTLSAVSRSSNPAAAWQRDLVRRRANRAARGGASAWATRPPR